MKRMSNMRRGLALLLVIAAILTVSACGEMSGTAVTPSQPSASQTESVPTASSAETTVKTSTTTASTTATTTTVTTTATTTTTTTTTTTMTTTTTAWTTTTTAAAIITQATTKTAMVWIPTRGGTKYHANESCSNMIEPQYVTLSEAVRQGFTPCKRCYR